MRAICRPAAIGELDDELKILYVQWKRKEGIEMRYTKDLRQAQGVRISQQGDQNERKEKGNLPTEQERRAKEGSEGGKRTSRRCQVRE